MRPGGLLGGVLPSLAVLLAAALPATLQVPLQGGALHTSKRDGEAVHPQPEPSGGRRRRWQLRSLLQKWLRFASSLRLAMCSPRSRPWLLTTLGRLVLLDVLALLRMVLQILVAAARGRVGVLVGLLAALVLLRAVQRVSAVVVAV